MSEKPKSKSKDKEKSELNTDKKHKKEKERSKDESKLEKRSDKEKLVKKSSKNKSGLDEIIKDIDEEFEKPREDKFSQNYNQNDVYQREYTSMQNPNLKPINLRQNFQNPVEHCDGCFDGEAQSFCTNCEKIFCRSCEDQIHLVPVNRMHERIPITNVYHLKKLCYHHHTPLKFYCDSCEEPVCHECQMIGPHNNKLHRITNVFDSFRKKFGVVNNTIQKSVINKLDQLTNQMQIIEFNIEEIKKIKTNIEREIRYEYSTMIENLRSEEGKKLAVLQYESATLNKEINKIHDIINIINEINYADSPDMIAFLLKYKQIQDTVETILAKPFKQSVDVPVDDFTRELEEKRRKMEKYEKMKNLVKAKDDIIWSLVQEKNNRDDKEIQMMKDKAHNEIAEWVKLSDKYAMELKKYNLVCHFCGCYLEENTVNSPCKKNITECSEKGNYTNKQISSDQINTGRHLFAAPVKEYDLNQTNIEKISAEKFNQIVEEEKKAKSSFRNPFENNFLNDSKFDSFKRNSSPPSGNRRYSEDNNHKECFNRIANIIEKNNINLYQALCELDIDEDGFINYKDIKIAFGNIQIKLTLHEVDNLLKYLGIANSELIPIKDFTRSFIAKSLN